MHFNGLAVCALVLLGACSGADAVAPTATPAPKVETVTLVTATLLDSAPQDMYAQIGPVNKEPADYRKGAETLLNNKPFNTRSITLPTGVRAARISLFNPSGNLYFQGDGSTQKSFRFLSDWSPKSATPNFVVSSVADLFAQVIGYTFNTQGAVTSNLPSTYIHATSLLSEHLAFSVQVPADQNTVHMYFPAQSYDFTCGDGSSSAIFSGVKGITYVVTQSAETYGTYTYSPAPVPSVKVECTTYSNIQAARIANPTLQIGQ